MLSLMWGESVRLTYSSEMQRDEKMGGKQLFNKKWLQIKEEIASRKSVRNTKALELEMWVHF